MEENLVLERKSTKSFLRLDTFPILTLIILLFLIPVFLVPSTFITFQFSKSLLVSIGVVLAFCLFLISVLKKGRFDLPTNKLFIAFSVIPLVFLISAILSDVSSMSFFGYGFEVGTFAFTLLMFMLVAMTSLIFRSEKRIFYSYLAFFAAVILVLVFHIIRLVFGPDTLTFGIFGNVISNTLGKWYDLGILFGISLVFSMVSLEMLSLNKTFKVLLYFIYVASLAFLVVINFTILWAVLAVFGLMFFVYVVSSEKISNKTEKIIGNDGEVVHISKFGSNPRKISVLALIVLVVSLFFALPIGTNPPGETLGNSIANKFGISNVEVRPSWQASIDISKKVLDTSPVFGVGPNRFSSQWQLYKPAEVNSTVFWNSDFGSAIGLIPTFFVTTGVVGLLSWLVFFALFLYAGFTALFARSEKSFSRYLTVSSFFVSLLLWVLAVVYVPSMSVAVLTFFFTGLFFAALYQEKILSLKTITFSSFPRASFAFVLSLVLILIASVSFGYVLVEKSISSYFFQKGIVALSQNNDIDEAEDNILKAVSVNGNDIYYRALSEINIIKLGRIVSSVSEDQVTEEVRNQFQQALGVAITNADKAVAFNNSNHENWLAVGKVYEAITPLGVDQAYENAARSYNEALLRSPHNPQIYLIFARLEAAKRDFVKAKENIAKALEAKSDYAEAIFFKSQIEVAEGDIKGAISSIEKIALISPTDAGVFFELGLLKYNNKDFAGAATAFEKAVAIIPEYSNARYFLGLSYQKTGKASQAIAQFETIASLNPDNTEVRLILTNLKAGKDAFADAQPPVDDKPESRDKLPVEEEN